MDLFSHLIKGDENYLPKDGIVNYFGPVLSVQKADFYFQELQKKIAWQNDQYFIAGKNITTNRQIAWYGDEKFSLNYSGSNKKGLIWINELLELKKVVEDKTKESFNSCLLNLYHTGEDGLGWHSDSEKGAVASLSLGATRKFVFKHKITKEKVEFTLSQGDLLVMKGDTQQHWLHRVPPTKKVKSPRINITFRNI
ncbi:alpha-ketoglutarate-dependent dioxygenase AlkB family protein [Reichenbachiella versicolor]|uniref:alpha-ketoglutarate-dependent dioxygenase AlkB family protein n=1 Tax=Reichenbachiella versicolor TaxID=1821036 RepID=UPI000D6E600B|nr:alpha-ketoglutarate-dependent dioxygenase AlkB [Reichenbachiella versicolor]